MKYEFHKLQPIIGKLAVIFLIINAVFCFMETTEDPMDIPRSAVEEFFEVYSENAAEMNEQYDLLGMELRWQNNYIQKSDSPLWNDYILYTEVNSRIDDIESYDKDIDRIINESQKQLKEKDGFAADYAEQVIGLYTDAKENVFMGLEYTRGWDKYFGYRVGDVLLFVFLLIVSAVVFAQEKNTGFIAVMHTSKNGRTKTALQKIAVMMLLTVAAVLLTVLETWLIIGLRVGYSSPQNGIQVFDALRLCPYIITVGEYFVLSVITKIAAYLIYSAVIMAVSVFVSNYAIIYIIGLGFFGVQFLMYQLHYITSNPLIHMNLVSAAAANPLFSRYRAVNLFGNSVSLITFTAVTFAVLFIAASLLTVWKHNRMTAGALSLKRLDTATAKVKEFFAPKHTSGKARQYTSSVYAYEMHKAVISSRYIIIAVILLVCRVALADAEFTASHSFTDSVYEEYMTTLAGEMTEEKRQYIADEREMIDNTIALKDEKQQAYLNGELTQDEYYEYLEDYNYATGRTETLQKIENHAEYIDYLAESGKEAWFVYDTGWKNLFFTDFDWIMYAVILLLFSGIFSVEYDSKSSAAGFAQILRTSKYGRKRTFACKYGTAVSIAAIITLVWNALDFGFVMRAYDLPMLDAPLWSIEAFERFAPDFTVMQYIICLCAVRMLASILMACLAASLSAVLKKNISAMTATVALTLLPAILSYFGITVLAKADFTALMQGTDMLLTNFSAVVYIIAASVICLCLTARAERLWNK